MADGFLQKFKWGLVWAIARSKTDCSVYILAIVCLCLCFQLRSEKFVFIFDENMAQNYTRTDCDIMMGEEKFYPAYYSFMFPKHSPYLPAFNRKYVFAIIYCNT